jgi:transposase-like protein
MAAPRKYSLELRERAVRMYRTSDPKPQIKKPAVDLGVHPEALRGWIRQAETDAGERDDQLTTDERAELAALRCARRTSSSSGRTRSCGRLRRFSRRSSTRPGPGDCAR